MTVAIFSLVLAARGQQQAGPAKPAVEATKPASAATVLPAATTGSAATPTAAPKPGPAEQGSGRSDP